MRIRSRNTGLIAMILYILVNVFMLAGCGKTGRPRPPQETDNFTFAASDLSAAGDCLMAHGIIQGATHNLDSIVLELAPVDGDDNCPTCPFTAQEWSEYRLDQVRLDPENGVFSFTYCPITQTNIYRWRLVGRNVHVSLPYVLTTPSIVVLPEQH